jgi:hypothetical protein
MMAKKMDAISNLVFEIKKKLNSTRGMVAPRMIIWSKLLFE